MNFLLVAVSAFFYVISFPFWNVAFAAFFALVPLFWAVENARSIFRAMGYGALWGLLVSAGMGYWLFPALIDHFGVRTHNAALFFLLGVAGPTCLIYAGTFAAYRFLHHGHLAWYALVVPAMWTLAEYVKEVVPFLVPWGGIGYAALPFHRFVQVADLGGIYGLTALIVMVNAVAWYIVRRVPWIDAAPGSAWQSIRRRPKIRYAPFALLILAFCLPTAYGAFRLHWLDAQIEGKTAAELPVQAVLVQGNFDLDERWSGMGFHRRLKTYLEMSAKDPETVVAGGGQAAKMRGQVIVWPETTLNEPAHLSDSLFRQIMAVVGDEALLVSGGVNLDSDTGRVTNCAYLVSGEGTLTRYDKHILLPYAETVMMFDWLGPYATAPREFSPGRTPPWMDTRHGRMGMSICFEILYPGYIARAVGSGAVFLVNMSNDAWFGDSPMPHMHLSAARMRAIENRRFLLRAANSGVSAVINPDGRVAAQTSLFQRQAIDGDFVSLDAVSPYTRLGNWPVLFSLFVLGGVLLRMVLKRG